MLNPGQFNKKITLKKRSIVTDELSQEIEEFAEYGTFWAMVKTTRSSEAVSSGNLQSLKVTRFVLRYSRSLNELIESDGTHFTLVYKGLEYDVTSVINDDEADKTVTIIAESKV